MERFKEVKIIYVVYADVLLLYHFIVNLTIIGMVWIVLGQTIRITHVILMAILIAAVQTGIFVITINLCTLYYVLYATSYLFMTYFFTRSSKNFKKTLLVIPVVCIWFAGVSQLLHREHQFALKNPWFYVGCIVSLSGCWIIRMYYDRRQKSSDTYEVELVLPDTNIHTYAFLDTGNHLKNPYTKKPAIILDYRLFESCLSKDSYRKLEMYHETGKFPYTQMNETEKIMFFPLPYYTIGNRFSLMPAITIKKLSFCTEKTVYYDVTAGISREPFLDEQFNVLLHEKFKP